MMAGAQVNSQSRIAAAKVVLPVVLTVMVLLGGSIRNAFVPTAILEALACLLLIWCLLDNRLGRLSRSAIWLLVLIAIGIFVCLLQLVPVPHAWWTALPGRDEIAETFRTSGIGDVNQPISLAPDSTLHGLLRFLPPLAVFVLIAKLPWPILSGQIAWAVALVAMLSATLALAQTFTGNQHFLFPYGADNHGQAPGIFEVVNHQATLQLIAIPFIALLLGNLRSKFDAGDGYQALGIVTLASLVLAMAAIFLSGSVAGYALAIPVVLLSCTLVIDRKPGPLTIAGVALVVIGLVAVAYVAFTSPLLKGLGVTDFGENSLSRRGLFDGTVGMVFDYWPVGAGLGAFETAYPAYEDPLGVTANYVSHAHNDYLEIAAELGLLGCLVLAGIVIWSGIMMVQAWRTSRHSGGRLKRAASIAVGVVLVHSLVDSPARTGAISCLAALALAVMSSGYSVRREGSPGGGPLQVFKHRHIEL